MEPWEIDLFKLLVAIAIGGLIGLERELSDKPAGFRTMILICVGSALFTIFSVRIAADGKDPGRIAAQIVTGVGFLGAGAILRDRRQVIGLTTAAAIWLVASLGVGIGLEQYRTVVPAAFMVVLVLFGFQRVERWIDRRRDDRMYDLLVGIDEHHLGHVRDLVRQAGLKVIGLAVTKSREGRRVSFRAVGAPSRHDLLTDQLLADVAVIEMLRD